MAALSRQGIAGIIPVKRATALAIWTELAFLIDAAIAKPLNGNSLAPVTNRPTPTVQIKPDAPIADWQKTAYQIIIYCLNNALSIERKNWK
jgi:hypothetical protein